MTRAVPVDISIVVVGGSGSTTVRFYGEILKSFMDAPLVLSGNVHYDHRVDTSTNKPAHLAPGLVDDVFDENGYPVNGDMTFRVSNSDTDGTFTLTVWFKA